MIRRPRSALGRQTSEIAEAPWGRRDRSSASGRPMQPAGELFLPPEVDQTRRFFSEKSRALIDKRMTVSEAIRRLIHNGAYIASTRSVAVALAITGARRCNLADATEL